MSSRHRDRREKRRSRSRSPVIRHKERRNERSRPNREENERVERPKHDRQNRKGEDRSRTTEGRSPRRKRERDENNHLPRNYEKSRERQRNGNVRDQNNEGSNLERDSLEENERVERPGHERQNRKGEDRSRTTEGRSPRRKRERDENNHLPRNYEKSRERQRNGNVRDQNNEGSNLERDSFLGDSEMNASQPKEEPNFELSGKLAEYTNTYKGVVIKYNEPPEALKPKTRWRLYPFKGDQCMSVLYIHRQSAYLIGRQRHIVDLAVDHPSCSKQHAALQYRLVDYERPDGAAGRKVKPYIIDLESSNGTFLNNQKIEARRYYELKEKDVLKFGFSSREYVLIHEKTKGSEVDDDDIVPEEQPQEDS